MKKEAHNTEGMAYVMNHEAAPTTSPDAPHKCISWFCHSWLSCQGEGHVGEVVCVRVRGILQGIREWSVACLTALEMALPMRGFPLAPVSLMREGELGFSWESNN